MKSGGNRVAPDAIQRIGGLPIGSGPPSRDEGPTILSVAPASAGGTEPLSRTRGQAGRGISTAPQPGRITPGSCMDKDYLVLKRALASRPSGEGNDDDFDVLAD